MKIPWVYGNVYGNLQLFFHMKWPFWGIKNPSGSPGGDGAPAPAKALWGEAPAAVLSWDQWIPWVFTGQNGQKGMME